MSIVLKQDNEQNIKIEHESDNVNSKILSSMDNKESATTAKVDMHNIIHNKFLVDVKNNKQMNSAYFKVTLTAVYSEIYKKNLVWKNIPDDADIQINITKILKNTSYVKVYDILKFYAKDSQKDMLDDAQTADVTALFYSSLYFFDKRKYEL